MKSLLPLGLVLLALLLSGFFVYVTTYRSSTLLEVALFQIFILLAGIVGSWWFGHQAEVNRSHARSAFRRVTSVYTGLSAAASIIDESREFDSVEKYRLAFARLEELVRSQLITADDALEDWRDMVPEDVRDLKKRLPSPSQRQE